MSEEEALYNQDANADCNNRTIQDFSKHQAKRPWTVGAVSKQGRMMTGCSVAQTAHTDNREPDLHYGL